MIFREAPWGRSFRPPSKVLRPYLPIPSLHTRQELTHLFSIRICLKAQETDNHPKLTFHFVLITEFSRLCWTGKCLVQRMPTFGAPLRCYASETRRCPPAYQWSSPSWRARSSGLARGAAGACWRRTRCHRNALARFWRTTQRQEAEKDVAWDVWSACCVPVEFSWYVTVCKNVCMVSEGILWWYSYDCSSIYRGGGLAALELIWCCLVSLLSWS